MPLVLADSTVDPHLQRCSLGTISGQSHEAIFWGWYRDGWGNLHGVRQTFPWEWVGLRLNCSSHLIRVGCWMVVAIIYCNMFCWCSHYVYDSINSQQTHIVLIGTKDVSGTKFLQSQRSCILVAGHETLVFAQWNSISKFCLSVSGTPDNAKQPLKETCKVQDFVKMQWTWMRWKQEGYMFYKICRYIWYGCESFEWRMAWVFYVLWLALLMETVGSRNQQASRDQKPAKERILDDHT